MDVERGVDEQEVEETPMSKEDFHLYLNSEVYEKATSEDGAVGECEITESLTFSYPLVPRAFDTLLSSDKSDQLSV